MNVLSRLDPAPPPGTLRHVEKSSAAVDAANPLVPPDDLILQNGIGGGSSDIAKVFCSIGSSMIAWMIRQGFIKPDSCVLDIGCGLGRLARPLVEHLSSIGTYYGLDVNRSSVLWCREHYAPYPNFHFGHADVFSTFYNPGGKIRAENHRLPFGDRQFDFVWSASLFTHLVLSQVDNYLKEIARVLKPGCATYNTFLILDEFATKIASDPAAPQNIRMPVKVEGGLIARQDNPEVLAGQYEDALREAHQRHGLEIQEMQKGTWCGRPDPRNTYQDIIIARKT